MDRQISYYVSGRVDGSMICIGNDKYARAIWGTCDHKHHTIDTAEKCAEKRRKDDGFVIAFGVDNNGYHVS